MDLEIEYLHNLILPCNQILCFDCQLNLKNKKVRRYNCNVCSSGHNIGTKLDQIKSTSRLNQVDTTTSTDSSHLATTDDKQRFKGQYCSNTYNCLLGKVYNNHLNAYHSEIIEQNKKSNEDNIFPEHLINFQGGGRRF